MCYAAGSIDHATGVCPMCQFFKPRDGRCPHKRETCKNVALHPKGDIVYLTNAEVQTFNGCGYCKWARTEPPSKQSGYQNPGWPGCCRPAITPQDIGLIPPADWPAVSVVHHIPIPQGIKAVLDSINASTSPRLSPSPPNANLSTKTPATPPMDRKSSNGILPTRATLTPASRSTQVISIPTKSRSNSSPKESHASLATSTRTSAASTKEGSPTQVSLELSLTHGRKQSYDYADKRGGDSPGTPSPLRRHVELETTPPHRSSDRRSSISKATSTPRSSLDNPPSLRRRASTNDTASSPNPNIPNPGTTATVTSTVTRSYERRDTISGNRPQPKSSSIDIKKDFENLSVSGSKAGSNGAGSNSSGSGKSDSRSESGRSSSSGTVTSDGGFTDYLSDESEAEIQRQAEIKAALIAQNKMEEQEFKMARQQLAGVGLKPPKSWNPNATPRSQVSQASQYSTISPGAFINPTRGQVDAVGYGRAH